MYVLCRLSPMCPWFWTERLDFRDEVRKDGELELIFETEENTRQILEAYILKRWNITGNKGQWAYRRFRNDMWNNKSSMWNKWDKHVTRKTEHMVSAPCVTVIRDLGWVYMCWTESVDKWSAEGWGNGDFTYGRVLEDSGRDGNCPDRKREHTTGNVWWSTMCLRSISSRERDRVGSVVWNVTWRRQESQNPVLLMAIEEG